MLITTFEFIAQLVRVLTRKTAPLLGSPFRDIDSRCVAWVVGTAYVSAAEGPFLNGVLKTDATFCRTGVT